MGILETLTLGSYLFTGWVYRELLKLKNNHIKHIHERLAYLESFHGRDPNRPEE
jgi:hypothetical protein